MSGRIGGNRKAQSAVEYLVTYSWAILVIAIALGALYLLGLFNPSTFITNQCVFPADFSCLSNFFYQNGSITINFAQQTISGINLTAAGCNAAGVPTNMTKFMPANYLQIGGNISITAYCYSNGTIFATPPGTVYRGYFIVNYTDLDTGFPHVLVGKVIEKST